MSSCTCTFCTTNAFVDHADRLVLPSPILFSGTHPNTFSKVQVAAILHSFSPVHIELYRENYASFAEATMAALESESMFTTRKIKFQSDGSLIDHAKDDEEQGWIIKVRKNQMVRIDDLSSEHFVVSPTPTSITVTARTRRCKNEIDMPPKRIAQKADTRKPPPLFANQPAAKPPPEAKPPLEAKPPPAAKPAPLAGKSAHSNAPEKSKRKAKAGAASSKLSKVVIDGADISDYEESFDVDITDDSPYAGWNIIEPPSNWTESKIRGFLLSNPKNAPLLKAIVAIQEPCDGIGHDFIFIEVEHPTTFQLVRTRVAYSIILRVPAYADVVRKYHSIFKKDRRTLEFPIPVEQ